MALPLILVNAREATAIDVEATVATALLSSPEVSVVDATPEVANRIEANFGANVRLRVPEPFQPETNVIVLQAGVCVTAESLKRLNAILDDSATSLGRILLSAEEPLVGATWFSQELLASNNWTAPEVATADLAFDRQQLPSSPNARRWIRAEEVGMALRSSITTDLESWAKNQRLPQLKQRVWRDQTRPRLATAKRKLKLSKQRREFHKES